MDFFTSPDFLLFARLTVGGVFLVSAIGKLLDKAGTAASMARYPFLPRGSGKLISNYFPFVELTVGLLLVLGIFTRLAAVGAVVLFLLFTSLIAYDLRYNKNISCHCFGRFTEEKLTPMAVVRNVVLMALAALLIVSFDGWLALDSSINQSTNGSLGLLTGTTSGARLEDAVPIALLALATIGIVVLGGQAVATVRTTLRGISIR
jgi:hypothetical protein